ncbi:MAG: aromatic aminobenezylarsenical efflux permease ArsG family transporter [Bacteroidales bacterium]
MGAIQTLIDNSQFQLLTAFLLGLMTAISPCPLATNITAVAYLGQNIENRRKVFFNGLVYTLGRAITYFSLAILMYLGASKVHLARFFQVYGEKIIGPLFVIAGLLMLDLIKINLPGISGLSEKFKSASTKGSSIMALIMGIVFAMAFCPYSGVIYFGMLIPMTIASPSGLYLPLIFALATGLPVIIFAYLIAFTLSGVGNLYNKLQTFELWFRRVVALLFILVGGYYIWMLYISPLIV